MATYKERLQENNDRLNAIQNALNNKIASSEQKLEKEFNLSYAKQMDLFDSIFGFRKISEKDYSNSEIQRLEKILINLTQGGQNGKI